MRDAYQRFFESCLPKEQLFAFGLSEIISCKPEVVDGAWTELQEKVRGNRSVYIRSFGRNGSGSHLFTEFYRLAIGNENVAIDPTNNSKPTEALREFTGFTKTPKRGFELLRNYQVSHVFGRTKNVFAFTAPWNIVFIPKILDPFTGHEAKGDAVSEFIGMFQREVFERFAPQIQSFNETMENEEFRSNCVRAIGQMERSGKYELAELSKFRRAVSHELSPISVEA
tara:strand:- start:94698 stop:95375 length:678 start_codon:yes stop_codon:yes gene_type:complete